MTKNPRSKRKRGRPHSSPEEPYWSFHFNTWAIMQLIEERGEVKG